VTPDWARADKLRSFVSLLIAPGATVVEVARQVGHAPTMTVSTYAHLLEGFAGGDRISAAELICVARAQFVSDDMSILCPRLTAGHSATAHDP
jgi:transposase-like protein